MLQPMSDKNISLPNSTPNLGAHVTIGVRQSPEKSPPFIAISKLLPQLVQMLPNPITVQSVTNELIENYRPIYDAGLNSVPDGPAQLSYFHSLIGTQLARLPELAKSVRVIRKTASGKSVYCNSYKKTDATFGTTTTHYVTKMSHSLHSGNPNPNVMILPGGAKQKLNMFAEKSESA
jgi:hypothetical protein